MWLRRHGPFWAMVFWGIQNLFVYGWAADVGHIQIACPSGVKVLLDGEFKGTTSEEFGGLILENIATGKHTVRFVREGFDPQEMNVEVQKDKVFSLKVQPFKPKIEISEEGESSGENLDAQTGSLQIQSLPIECAIDVPGAGISKAKKSKDVWTVENVPIGTYEAKFSSNGKEIAKTVSIERGMKTRLMVNFLRQEVQVLSSDTDGSGSEVAKPRSEQDGRFQVSRENVIKDTQTGLEWLVGPDKDIKYDDAVNWVKSQTVAGGGWRMPTMEDLKGLYQKGKGDRNMDPVFSTTGREVWGDSKDASSAWGFNFYYGADYWGIRDCDALSRVFGVRSSPRR